jgi:hypothetical protein
MLFDAGFFEGMEHSTLASQYRDIFVKDLSWDVMSLSRLHRHSAFWQKKRPPGRIGKPDTRGAATGEIARGFLETARPQCRDNLWRGIAMG